MIYLNGVKGRYYSYICACLRTLLMNEGGTFNEGVTLLLLWLLLLSSLSAHFERHTVP